MGVFMMNGKQMKRVVSCLLLLVAFASNAVDLSSKCTPENCRNKEKFKACLVDKDFAPTAYPACMDAAFEQSYKDPTFWTNDIEKIFKAKTGVASRIQSTRHLSQVIQVNQRCHDGMMERPIRILSIDGGGVRGIIPAVLVAAIEHIFGLPITEIFDVFVGTSTGGLISIFLNIPDKNGKQKYTAVEVIELYKTLSRSIFKTDLYRVAHINGLIGARYDPAPLESYLKKYTGNLTVMDTVKPIVITSYDTYLKNVFLFSTFLAEQEAKSKRLPNGKSILNLSLYDAGRATSAAPTYFPPLDLSLSSGAKLTLVDGGVALNNPSVIGLLTALKAYPNRRYIIVSFGTGQHQDKQAPAGAKFQQKKAFIGGIIQMLSPTIKSMMNAASQLNEDILTTLLNKQYFFRINPNIPKDLTKMDNVDTKNIAALEAIGFDIVMGEKNNTAESLAPESHEYMRLIEQLARELYKEGKWAPQSVKRRAIKLNPINVQAPQVASTT